MAMLMGLPVDYQSTVEHIKLGRISKSLNMMTIRLLLIQCKVELSESGKDQLSKDHALAIDCSNLNMKNGKPCSWKGRGKGSENPGGITNSKSPQSNKTAPPSSQPAKSNKCTYCHDFMKAALASTCV
jgi:hypothetical protein